MSNKRTIQVTPKIHSVDGNMDYNGVVALLLGVGAAGDLWRVTGSARVVLSGSPGDVRHYLYDTLFIDTGTGDVSAVWTLDREVVVGSPVGTLTIGTSGTYIMALFLGMPGSGTYAVELIVDLTIEKIDDPSQIQIALPLRG